jgi:tripartite-type tricarboxylate transporter receptor subunit TctC
LNANLYSKLTFNTERDFAQISMLGLLPYVLVGHVSMPDTIHKLIALAKKNRGEISIASYGSGSISHLAAEMLQEVTGIKLLHVPYKGGPPAVIDTLSGQTMIHIGSLPTVLSFIRNQRLRAYGMATARRSPELPDLPTMAELLGNKDYDVVTEVAIMAPAGTPTRIIERLHSDITKILSQPDTQKSVALLGYLTAPTMLPAQIAAHYRAEIPKWGRVIKNANVKLD